jgi:two-component system, OmpR family, response regulator
MSERLGQQETVLVIDDSAIALEVVKVSLEEAGFRVITRSRTSGAVSAILATRPDIVLLDVNMPLISGDVIAGILARTGPALDTAVILHSSLPIELLRLKAIAAGAHGYIVKTSDGADLVRQVRHWLRRARSARRHGVFGVREGSVTADETEPIAVRPSEIRVPIAASSVAPSVPVVDDRGASAPPPRKLSGTLRLNASATALFVDDDPVMLSAYRRELDLDDVEISFTLSGQEALGAILSHNPPDVVVCDIMLRDLGGMDIYRKAMEHDSSWKHRFVFVTGAASIPHVADFLKDVESRVLLKPVDPRRLRAAIRYSATGARMFRRDRTAETGR